MAVDGQAVPAHGADSQGDQGSHHSQKQAVLHILEKSAADHIFVGVQTEVFRQKMKGVSEQLRGVLKGAHEQPDNGKYHHKGHAKAHNGGDHGQHALFIGSLTHSISPPFVALNWIAAMIMNTILTTTPIAEA